MIAIFTTGTGKLGGLLALGVLLTACPDDDRPMDMDDVDMDVPMHDMTMDPEMMQRHADEADAMAAEMRAHLGTTRGLPADEQHARMGEHVGAVSRMLRLMDGQMREMSMGMPMDDEAMGAMMGMSAQEHRQMMDEMAGLRAELEELQVAPVDQVRARMPAHLDRVEAMVRMLEHSAEHMR